MTFREVIKRLEAEGWLCVRQRGSHQQFKHPDKPGLVTVAGRPPKQVPRGTLRNIARQAGWEDV